MLTGEMPIDPWYLTFSEFIASVCNKLKFILISNTVSNTIFNKNSTLNWQQNSCPGTSLIFLIFSYWAIWRVITCLPLTLLRCFINTAQHLLSLLSKTLPNTCSWCSIWSFFSPSHLKVLLSTNTSLPHPFQSHPNS